MSSPPVKYLRYFDFTNFATLNPDKPLPGASVDVEFNRIKSTSDQTIDRLNLIQRDDGLLRDGAITTNSLADGAVTEPKLANLAVSTRTLQDDSVTGSKIQHGAISSGHIIDNGIVTRNLTDLSVTTPKIADGAVTGAKIAPGSLSGAALAPGSITSTTIADGGVATVDLADGAVTNPKLALLSVATGNVQDNSITLPKLNDNSVSTLKLVDLSVTTPKLADGAVTTAKIAPGAVDSTKLAPGAVTPGAIADGTLPGAKLVDGSVTTAKLVDGSVTLAKMAPNSVDSSKIVDGTIAPVDLSAATLSLISSPGNPRGAWVTATNYAAKDSVTNGSGVYVCVLPHLSGVFADDLAAGKWLLTGQIFDQSLNKADVVQFAAVRLGGTTNGFAQLKGIGPTLQAYLADNSGLADFYAKGGFFSGNVQTGTTLEVRNAGSAVNKVVVQHDSVNGHVFAQSGFLVVGGSGADTVVFGTTQCFPVTNNATEWGNAANRWKKLWSVDGDFSGDLNVTGSITGTLPGVPNANKVINGAMRICQYPSNNINLSAANTAGFAVDRWHSYWAVLGAQTVNVTTVVDAPPGFLSSLKYTVGVGGAPAPNDYDFLSYAIEGIDCRDLNWGTANASPVTVSFWVKSSIIGNYCISFENAGTNRFYNGRYIINAANTWEKKTITVPGDVGGVWDQNNGAGMFIRWGLGCGAQRTAAAINGWIAPPGPTWDIPGNCVFSSFAGATWQITNVKAEIGSIATPFVMPLYAEELAKCYRYYYRRVWTGTDYVALLSAYSANTFTGPLFPLPQQMRVAPTLGQVGGLVAWTPNQGGNAGMSLVTLRSNDQQVWCGDSSAVGSFWSAGLSVLVTSANVTFYITCQSEL